jgi:hypothetical protein
MRLLALSITLVVGTVVIGQDKPSDATLPLEKWKMDYGTKTWGLKTKSVTLKDGLTFVLVLGIEKDLTAAELKELKEAFPERSTGKKSAGVAFVFFDKDDVIVQKVDGPAVTSSSEVSGVKGDAFRVEITIPPQLIEGAVRVEFRSTKEQPPGKP